MSAPPVAIILEASEGRVEIVPLPGGRLQVSLQPNDDTLWIPRRSCETSLPVELVEKYLEGSFAFLCDSLARHDDPEYVARVLRRQLMAYVDAEEFRGKRLLDFGCGTGASTLNMAALLPETEVVGVDLDPESLEMAREVRTIRHLSNARFLRCPDGNHLPYCGGNFDFAMLSAVYEHLLPDERRRVLPLIWASLKPGGVLFINQTPHRYFPYEYHSTGLWLINYLPDSLAFFVARRYSRREPALSGSRSWTEHLRGGIRGGSEAEVLCHLRRAGEGKPTVLQPREGDRAAYWMTRTSAHRSRFLKRMAAGVFRVTDRLFGTVPSMNLDVAIRKDAA